MTDRDKDLIQYRLERAYETFEDAKILHKSKRWKACVNLLMACSNETGKNKNSEIRSWRNFKVIRPSAFIEEVDDG